MSGGYDYVKSPDEIYRRSFAAIKAEANLDVVEGSMRGLAMRLIHASGMTDVIDDLAFSEGAADIGRQALAAGCNVFCDVEMVANGIIRSGLAAGTEIRCTLNDDGVRDLAGKLETTRTAAAIDLWKDEIEGSVVAIGNAPTALFRLLENLGEGWPRPALVLGFPVGFIGARESKDALAEAAPELGVPFVTLKGRRGGSAMAAAAVNALVGDYEQ